MNHVIRLLYDRCCVMFQHAVQYRRHVMAARVCTKWTALHTAVLAVRVMCLSLHSGVSVRLSSATSARGPTARCPIRSSATTTMAALAGTPLGISRRSRFHCCCWLCVWCQWSDTLTDSRCLCFTHELHWSGSSPTQFCALFTNYTAGMLSVQLLRHPRDVDLETNVPA